MRISELITHLDGNPDFRDKPPSFIDSFKLKVKDLICVTHSNSNGQLLKLKLF